MRSFDDELANLIESLHRLSREAGAGDNEEYYHQLDVLFKKVQQMEIDDDDQLLGACLDLILAIFISYFFKPASKSCPWKMYGIHFQIVILNSQPAA